MAKKEKKTKEKVRYYDDGSTIVDMSGVGKQRKKNEPRLLKTTLPRSTARDKWTTYKNAVKMCFFPMLVVLGILGILYLMMCLILGYL